MGLQDDNLRKKLHSEILGPGFSVHVSTSAQPNLNEKNNNTRIREKIQYSLVTTGGEEKRV